MSVGILLMGDLKKRRDADAALDGGKDSKRLRVHTAAVALARYVLRLLRSLNLMAECREVEARDYLGKLDLRILKGKTLILGQQLALGAKAAINVIAGLQWSR